MGRLPALVLLLSAAFAAGAGRAHAGGNPMADMFKGIPVDRCKERGGPPTSVPEGPRIESMSVGEGRPGDPVVISGGNQGTTGAVEVRFLLRGIDVPVAVEAAEGGALRVRVPDLGVKADAKGWIYLARGPVRGKARSFLFKPPAPASP